MLVFPGGIYHFGARRRTERVPRLNSCDERPAQAPSRTKGMIASVSPSRAAAWCLVQAKAYLFILSCFLFMADCS